ncbi:spermine synthase-like isoform X1 [Haliotis rufescens]|uniref:spermine synthase-like isoform X1 n=2 Tax=Haliotis rufescens TaxID=6454 RepID=UPI001EAFAF54|nr:spermine synthase-like isoform X1 [Haliotis rufescens]
MEAQTFMLWFQLDRERLADHENEILSRVKTLPGLFWTGTWTTAAEKHLDAGGVLYTIINSDGSHAVMRLFPSGLLTLDLQRLSATQLPDRPYSSAIKLRLERMKKHLGKYCLLAKTMPVPVHRSCEPPWPYMITGDERIIERDFTELVFETNSRWQNIKIFKSKQCGNVLYLDDDVMIGESDLVYTETVLGLDRNDFTGKTVLILGGGDGGLLHELVTRTRPAFVTMVEIDEEVMKACRTHMRSICGSALDQYEGENYKIEIDDCINYMKRATERNATFDYVVNDLTEFSVDKENYGFDYDFATSSVNLELSIRVLSPEGKYLARGNTTSCATYVAETKKNLQRLGMVFDVFTKYVPSFQEIYCFFEAWKEKAPS